MTTTETTLRTALRTYFAENGFGENGGYDDAWVDFSIGPVPLPFPNTEGRKRAVRFHDLHHILTGYGTNATGEFEISAWELGAGCKDFHAARFINSGGFVSGILSSPRRTFRAFVRGRNSRSLYGERYEDLLDLDVSEARANYVGEGSAKPTDIALFVTNALVGTVTGLLFAAVAIPLLPVGLLAVLRNRKEKAKATATAS